MSLGLAGVLGRAAPVGTAFIYQGRLDQSGQPASGLYDMQFALFDAVTNGNPVGGPASARPVAVSNGLFAVALDFGGAAFLGEARWLEIAVRTNGSLEAHAPLVPRTRVAPTPYAFHAANAASVPNSAITTPMLALGAVNNARLADGSVTAAKIADAQVVRSLNGLRDDVTLRAVWPASRLGGGPRRSMTVVSSGPIRPMPISPPARLTSS